MTDAMYQFVSVDAPPLMASILASMVCGLLGSLLVLRRQAMVGDAISHAVLPGLVIAFLVTGTRESWPMFIGAALAGLATVLITSFVKRVGRVEGGAAMGVVFSMMFAVGVLLIERASARQVDLDPDCVLYGMLETLFWFPPRDSAAWSLATLAGLPRQVQMLAAAAVVIGALVALFWKEIKVASFDPGLASALGIRAGAVDAVLMTLVAGATVAAFEAVGSILVIAMLVCPAAAARMLTDRFGMHVLLSTVIGAAVGVAGYALGAWGPGWVGMGGSVSVAGMIAVCGGAVLLAASIAGPRHGVLAKVVRRLLLAARIAGEDALGLLYRAEESGRTGIDEAELRGWLGSGVAGSLGLRRLTGSGLVARDAGSLRLTEQGRDEARSIVRSHRLWESYLVRETSLRPDHVHDTAMKLEHARIGAAASETRLAPDADGVVLDPHKKPIPPR